MSRGKIKIISAIEEMQRYSDSLRLERKKIALVPTMGYLHEGHLSLVKKAKELADITIVSIFVNPSQFSPDEDLEKYPRDFERDKKLLWELNVDVIFYPDVSEIYPDDFQTHVEVEKITQNFEGAFRPTHFRGVTTIVNILFNCVKPDIAIFGQKDAQQAAVIKRMVRDLKLDIKIIAEPIVREEDGLAMSSRNIYLSAEERKDALVLSKALNAAGKMILTGETNVEKIYAEMKNIINSAVTSELDYIKIVNAENFEEIDYLEEGNSYFILIACRIGKTRLIDNLLIKENIK